MFFCRLFPRIPLRLRSRRWSSSQSSVWTRHLQQLVVVFCRPLGLLLLQPELVQDPRVQSLDGERVRGLGQSEHDRVWLPGRLFHPRFFQGKCDLKIDLLCKSSLEICCFPPSRIQTTPCTAEYMSTWRERRVLCRPWTRVSDVSKRETMLSLGSRFLWTWPWLVTVSW